MLNEGSERLTRLGLTHRIAPQRGDPANCIAKAARDAQAELVVVGQHKTGRVARWLHEPPAAALVEMLDCSVLSGKMDITDEVLYGQSA